MRVFASVLACATISLGVAGCDPATDKHYLKKGIGTELYTSSIGETTNELETFVHETCLQAGLIYTKDGECASPSKLDRATAWTLFVQAGMNDIDRRCDAYLVWLDNIRRAEAPTLKQFSDTNVATQLVLTATSAGIVPMALVATAFGYASDTLTNVNSRLILTVNHSTVQAVVLGKQRDFRKEVLGDGKTKPAVIIDNRPAAIFALRSYMRLCMPMTIETEINNTIIAFQSGGIDAYKNNPMISAVSIARPLTADERVGRPSRPRTPTKKEYAQLFTKYRADVHSIDKVERALRRMCIPEGAQVDQRIATQIKIFQQTEGRAVTGKLTDPEFDLLQNAPVCTANAVRNYFEKNRMPVVLADIQQGKLDQSVISDMNLLLPADRQIKQGTTLAVVRSRIGEVRSALQKKIESDSTWQVGATLRIPSAEVADQFSQDFQDALTYYRQVVRPRESASAAPNPNPNPNSNTAPNPD